MSVQNNSLFSSSACNAQADLNFHINNPEFLASADKLLDDIIQQKFNPKKRKLSVSQPLELSGGGAFKKVKLEPSASQNDHHVEPAPFPKEEITLPNGDRYVYSKINGKREGSAKGYLKNGSVLDFIFLNDFRHGPAALKNSRGDVIHFYYVEGQMQGKAIEHKADGTTIQFSYVDNFKEGQARLTCPAKKISLEYHYHHGLKEGAAILKHSDQFTVKFSYVEGEPEGYAEFECPSYKMVFNYSEGVREGVATLCYTNGEIKDFMFNEGKATPYEIPAQISPEGKGLSRDSI